MTDKAGKLSIEKTPNAVNPVVTGDKTPILTMDVWEHAYYLDVQVMMAPCMGAMHGPMDARCVPCARAALLLLARAHSMRAHAGEGPTLDCHTTAQPLCASPLAVLPQSQSAG